jgi:AraC-like DNA-binding protein
MKALDLQGLEMEVPLVPAVYSRFLCHFLQKKGVSIDAIMAGVRIDQAILDDPEAYLSMRQSLPLLKHAMELAPDPLTAFEFGRELDLSKHGSLGFCMTRQINFRELVNMNVQYLRVRLPLMDLEVRESRAGMTILVKDVWPMDEVRNFVAQIYMGNIASLGALVSRHMTLEFDFPAPAHPAMFEKLCGCPTSFSRGANRAFIPLSQSGHVKASERADFIASSTARQDIDLDDDRELVVQIRHMIARDPGRRSSLENIANRLGLSPRSLRRQLQNAGFSFSDIRNEVRLEFAQRYLTGTRMPMEKIASRLGYSDQASFSKAFRSWTGIPPGQVRRRAKASEKQA